MKDRLTNTDEVIAAYHEALADWRAGAFDKARLKTKDIRKFVTKFPKLSLLEAFIARDKNEFLTELSILHHCLEEIANENELDTGLAAEAWSMIGSACHELGKTKEALKAFVHSIDLEPDLVQQRIEASNLIFAANSAAHFTADDFRSLYQRYQTLLDTITPFHKQCFSHNRLRIGYLSADFCGHPVGRLILPLFEHHDKSYFAVYGYAASDTNDVITERLRKAADRWQNVSSVSDEDVARLIREDEIDILVELGVHTKGNRLPVLAYRPATVQICGIGDVRSSGLSCVDYFLSDVWCAGDESWLSEDFSERIICLPHTQFCYTLPETLPPISQPPCISRNHITFGSFNNASKLTDDIISVWSELLRRIPSSHLLLKHKLFGCEEGRRFTKERMEKLGIDIARVEFRGYSPNHLLEYADVDVALDTYPYTGGMTTLEALSMGVPVVTRYGRRHRTRFGYSILQNLGLGELAASSADRYIEIAEALVMDKELLVALRNKMRSFLRVSPLTNAVGYTRDMENVYRSVWKETVNKEGGKC